MEPTIYKPSIYKGAGIYNTGAEGVGGGDWAKNTQWNTTSGTKYNGETRAFETLFSDYRSGQGGIICRTSFNLNNFVNKLEFQAKVFIDKNGVNPATYARIINNLKTGGNRFVRIYVYRNSGVVEFRLPDNSLGNFKAINLDNEHEFKIELERKNANTASYKISIDGGERHFGPYDYTSNIILYPTFFCGDEITPETNSFDPQMCVNDKLFLNGTYLKIDNELVFGQE